MNVFVSYALSDRDWVHGFAACLRTVGLEVSSWGSSFQLAGDRQEGLERRIAGVDLVVLVLSEGFLACAHVLHELGAATLAGKPITSVLIEPDGKMPAVLPQSTAAAAERIREYVRGLQGIG